MWWSTYIQTPMFSIFFFVSLHSLSLKCPHFIYSNVRSTSKILSETKKIMNTLYIHVCVCVYLCEHRTDWLSSVSSSFTQLCGRATKLNCFSPTLSLSLYRQSKDEGGKNIVRLFWFKRPSKQFDDGS